MTIQSWSDVERLTDELTEIADWLDVFSWKLVCPQRHFEPAHLEAEANSFKRECQSLAQSWSERI